MSEEAIDYLERTGGPGITELPDRIDPLDLPGAEDAGAAGGEGEPSLFPGWEQGTVEQFLRGGGAGIHMLIGAGEKDWLLTKQDLDRIAPPLTRIANRWEPALRLSPFADPILLSYGVVLYAWRSALERQRALRDRAELEPEDELEEDEREEEDELDVGEGGSSNGTYRPLFPDSPRARKAST
jgi:hypothetical protein